MRDEGPSPEDIRRFSDHTGYCPDCGAEVWDALDVCPECGAAMIGGTRSRSPLEGDLHKRMIIAVVVIVLIAFLLVYVL